MSEEKKKGWFQKIKSAVFGGPESEGDISEGTNLSETDKTEPKSDQDNIKQVDEKPVVSEANLETNVVDKPKEEIKPDQKDEVKTDLEENTNIEKTIDKVDDLKKVVQESTLVIDPNSPAKTQEVIKPVKEIKLKSLDISDITNKKSEQKADPVIEEEKKPETITENKVEEEAPKGWFSKVVDTLNSPIEIKLESADGDDSLLSKLRGNISIGLGKPVVRETDEEREIWRAKLKDRLANTRQAFTEKLERVMHGRTKIDDDLLEEIEEILLESDVGVEMTDKISAKIRTLAKEKRFLPEEVMPSLFDYLRNEISMQEERIIIDESRLNIIMMVGVNGTGKTTTTGKIAAKLAISEYSVILGAADTFRAAAIEQLEVWGQRAGVPIVKHQENSDAAAVVHDAINSARAKKANVLLIDTAGRLHNKAHLMDELKKIRRIIDKEAPEAKLEVLLVLDATTGQNGLSQAMVFAEAVQLTGVVLTKLDGTAKGGVIFSIKNSLKLPIKLVGVGEGLDDLRDFQPQIFVDALFSEKSDNLIEHSTKTRG
ncbi:MAG: signal recognition particle-docking protein FtsY [Rickettsiales bacterium]|nr:MAG: signal recognition particle-docking protein FtsY [Rickettsiales bacterium]